MRNNNNPEQSPDYDSFEIALVNEAKAHGRVRPADADLEQ